MIGLLIAGAAAIFGYMQARSFTRRRLRFVDAIQNGGTPWIAGLLAAAVIWPLSVFPLISAGTAIAFGLGVGTGVNAGVSDIRKGRYLTD